MVELRETPQGWSDSLLWYGMKVGGWQNGEQDICPECQQGGRITMIDRTRAGISCYAVHPIQSPAIGGPRIDRGAQGEIVYDLDDAIGRRLVCVHWAKVGETLTVLSYDIEVTQ
jgi:hypothetical protein